MYYAVAKGKKPGVYRTWSECEQQVKGYPYAKFKKFKTEAQALQFIEGSNPNKYMGSKPRDRLGVITSSFTKSGAGDDPAMLEGAPKNMLKTSRSIKEKLRDFEHCSWTKETAPKPEPGHAVVYTDGACPGNGCGGTRAAIGVFWGDGDARNVAEPLAGRPTNNRAEIHAAIKACRQAKEGGITHLTIKTDSQFMIDSMTKWINGWIKRDWHLASGGEVKNRDDFKELLEAKEGLTVRFEKVPGHAGVYGNEMADRLANEGLTKDIKI